MAVTDGAQAAGSAQIQTVHYLLTEAQPTRSTTVTYDQTTRRVWNANQDNNTVTATDVATLSKTFEIPVGQNPRTVAFDPAGRIWVANQDDATLTVLRASDGRQEQLIPLPRASRPYGVVLDPAGTHVYVSLQASGLLLKLRASDGSELGRAAVGPDPRGLAVTADGARIFVTRLRSPDTHGVVTDITTATMQVAQVLTLALDDTTIDGQDRARGLPNYLGSVTVSPDGRTAWVPSKSDNILRGRFRDGQALNFENSLRAITSRIDLRTHSEVARSRIDFNDREMPVAVELTPRGDYAYVALQGSGKVEIRDGYTGLAVGAMDDTGFAPHGLAQTPDGGLLFVHNFMSRSLRVYDTADVTGARDFAPVALATISLVQDEKLSPQVLRGKQIFYNAGDRRMSRDGYISCAGCHLDGDQDGRVWDFGDRGEGLRNTISLVGRAGTGHGPVHWSANFDEIQDFENDIRGAFGGTGLMSDQHFQQGTRSQPLGDRKGEVSPDLDALAAYVTSLNTFHLSPYRSADGTLSAAGEAGRVLFEQFACARCHAGTAFTDSESKVLHDVGTLMATSGGRLGGPLTGIDTPTLRGIWETGPYLHDGSAATLGDVLTQRNAQGAHGGSFSVDEVHALEAYLRELE